MVSIRSRSSGPIALRRVLTHDVAVGPDGIGGCLGGSFGQGFRPGPGLAGNGSAIRIVHHQIRDEQVKTGLLQLEGRRRGVGERQGPLDALDEFALLDDGRLSQLVGFDLLVRAGQLCGQLSQVEHLGLGAQEPLVKRVQIGRAGLLVVSPQADDGADPNRRLGKIVVLFGQRAENLLGVLVEGIPELRLFRISVLLGLHEQGPGPFDATP